MKEWIIKKLKEKSNWLLIINWAAGFGLMNWKPELKDSIAQACTAITVAIAVYLDDKSK